ncbi:hypothetical protein TorRG33x02_108010 [Trema orientale]|uniref:Uncharacterized protein n=1 Tax=Trema orientale TaxID=63057 RepID=A0A2P5F6V1_TREOI|nr:hypothetical protein TorRG33x02_108010 [Trema orientale]
MALYDRGKILHGADIVLVSDDENISPIQAPVGGASLKTGSDLVIDSVVVEHASGLALPKDTLGMTHSANSSIVSGASENLVELTVNEDRVLANLTQCFAVKSKSNRKPVALCRKNMKFSPKGKCFDSMNKSPIQSFLASGLRIGRSPFLSLRKKTLSPKKLETQMC